MTLPASITTNLFSDFKNSSMGPFPAIFQVVQDTDNSVSQAIGSTNPQKVAQSFQVSTAGDLTSIEIYAKKLNSPTDSILITLCADNAGEPGTVLGTGTPIPVATFVGTAFKYARSVFFVPPALATSTTYWIVAERSGSLDATNNFQWNNATGNPYANGKLRTYNGSAWSDVSSGNGDGRFKVNVRTSGRYQPAVDKTNNKIRMYKSTDNGNTWSEQDSANAPSISTTSNLKSVSAVPIDNLIQLFHSTATGFSRPQFNTTTDTWGSATTVTSTLSTNVSGAAPILGGQRTGFSSSLIVAYNGATETVMGSARRRVKVKRFITAWNSDPGYDIIGSPNTPDTTLPGTAVDYDVRAVIMDGNGVFHVFWTQSDDSNVHHRQYNTDDTFSTANLLGSTPATTSNSAAYSIGGPANYYRSDEWYMAIPITTSGAIVVSKVKASLSATASNWTNTTVIASGAESTNSNPAVLIADNEQGGRLFLIFTKTDGKMYITHDSGSDTWVAEQEIHPGTKTVAGLSAGMLVDVLGTAYLDTSPTPDELRYDETTVFF